MKTIISEKGISLLRAISLISGSFTIIVALTMIFSLVQMNIIKPLDNPVLLNLKEQFDKDPENAELREQVRALDLVARRAYFSSRWQIETGTHLLLAGVIIFVLCQRLISGNKKEIPERPGEKSDFFLTSRRGRKYILYSAGIIFLGAVIASFILRNKLPDPSKVVIGGVKAIAGEVTESNYQPPEIVSPGPSDSILKPETPVPDPDVRTEVPVPGNIVPSAESTAVTSSESSLYASSFPSFRGKGGRGIADGAGYPVEWDVKEGKNIKWKWKVPKPGFNSPVIWGNKLFISGADKQGAEIYCIDKNTGKVLWTSAVSNIQGSQGIPETSEDTGLSAPSLATNGSFLSAIYANGNLVTLNMEGKIAWAKPLGLPRNHYGHSSSLITYGNVLLVQYDRNDKSSLLAFDIATGALRWETVRGAKISWASPVIATFDGKPQVILNADPFVAAYDPVTGTELWKIKSMSAEIGPSVAVNDNMVFAANEFAKLIAIKAGKEPSIVWEDNQFLPEVSSPVATNDYLFVATTYGTVACYNASTGELFWSHEFEYGFYSSPMIWGKIVYLLDVNGVMHVFNADKEFKLIAESPVGEKTVCTPAFSEGKLFIRGYENLFCIAGN